MTSKSQSLSGAQKRTRAALLAAAVDLLHAGEYPSVAQAAEAADVSRRTAYRYFPTQEQLLTEAALESLGPGIEASFAHDDDPHTRLESAIRSMMRQTAANERLLRIMIRLTIDSDNDATGQTRPVVRGTRRVRWVENALAPVAPQLTKAAFSRLVSSICLVVGPEALIMLRDVRELDVAAATDTAVWAAQAMLRAALDDPQKLGAANVRRSRR